MRTYVGPYEVGGPIDGGAVGRVVESRHDGFAEGDWVLSRLGWREQGVVAGDGLRKLDASLAPPSTALGVLGMPGLTAWVGLVDIGQIEEGETIYVSGAAGAVGSTAAQIAKLKGLRVIGSAGSPEKVDWLRSLGVEAFDYREQSPREALADGIDVCFDNVGGAQLEAALNALRPFGRVIACGAISRYNDERPEPGPRNLQFIVTKRLRMQGFIVSDHLDRLPAVHRRGRPVGGRRAAAVPRDRPGRDRERADGVRRTLPRRQHRQDARSRRASTSAPTCTKRSRRTEEVLAVDLEVADARRGEAGTSIVPFQYGRPAIRACCTICPSRRSVRRSSPWAGASAGAARRRSRRREPPRARSCRRSAGCPARRS